MIKKDDDYISTEDRHVMKVNFVVMQTKESRLESVKCMYDVVTKVYKFFIRFPVSHIPLPLAIKATIT